MSIRIRQSTTSLKCVETLHVRYVLAPSVRCGPTYRINFADASSLKKVPVICIDEVENSWWVVINNETVLAMH